MVGLICRRLMLLLAAAVFLAGCQMLGSSRPAPQPTADQVLSGGSQTKQVYSSVREPGRIYSPGEMTAFGQNVPGLGTVFVWRKGHVILADTDRSVS